MLIVKMKQLYLDHFRVESEFKKLINGSSVAEPCHFALVPVPGPNFFSTVPVPVPTLKF
jgi:hypothetical protein